MPRVERSQLAGVLSRLLPLEEDFPRIDDPPTKPEDPLGSGTRLESADWTVERPERRLRASQFEEPEHDEH